MRRGTGSRASTALVAVLASGLLLAGCSGDNDHKPDAAGSSSASTGTDEVATQATVTKVTGRLGAAKRDALAGAVAEVVDGWFDGAYLGDFPRSDFAGAFAGFTKGAAEKAQRNLDQMSSKSISSQIETAEATRRSLSLDVLSIKQKPVGVTATVDLVFETTGSLTGTQEVTGTLDLTPDGDSWKVFGFEISRTPTAPSAATTSASPEAAS